MTFTKFWDCWVQPLLSAWCISEEVSNHPYLAHLLHPQCQPLYVSFVKGNRNVVWLVSQRHFSKLANSVIDYKIWWLQSSTHWTPAMLTNVKQVACFLALSFLSCIVRMWLNRSSEADFDWFWATIELMPFWLVACCADTQETNGNRSITYFYCLAWRFLNSFQDQIFCLVSKLEKNSDFNFKWPAKMDWGK